MTALEKVFPLILLGRYRLGNRHFRSVKSGIDRACRAHKKQKGLSRRAIKSTSLADLVDGLYVPKVVGDVGCACPLTTRKQPLRLVELGVRKVS